MITGLELRFLFKGAGYFYMKPSNADVRNNPDEAQGLVGLAEGAFGSIITNLKPISGIRTLEVAPFLR